MCPYGGVARSADEALDKVVTAFSVDFPCQPIVDEKEVFPFAHDVLGLQVLMDYIAAVDLLED